MGHSGGRSFHGGRLVCRKWLNVDASERFLFNRFYHMGAACMETRSNRKKGI